MKYRIVYSKDDGISTTAYWSEQTELDAVFAEANA